jgi:hypothetical protein
MDPITLNDEGYPVGAWRIDLEDFDTLEKTSFEGWESQVEGLYAEPEEIDPRPFHRVEHQQQQGACQGHELSSIGEHCWRIATQENLQFSRQFCYIETQRIDGLIGRDVGSTIGGGEQLAKTKGFPLESFWQYTGVYHTNPPGGIQACYNDGKKRLIKTSAAMRSYADCRKFLGAGVGGISLGIPWNASMHSKGVIESYDPNLPGGGHALAFLGYSKRVDAQGRKYLWLLNSWGTTWGQKGWAEVAPAAIDQMFRSRYTVMRGLSDMQTDAITPRPVDFSQTNSLFRKKGRS